MFAACLLASTLLTQTPSNHLVGPEFYQLPKDAVARIGSPRFRHAGEISALTFSPDSRWLASASSEPIDGTARLWDTTTGHLQLSVKLSVPVGPMTQRSGAVALGFASDGKLLLVVDEKHFRAIRISDGSEVRRFDLSNGAPLGNSGKPPSGVGIAPNGGAFVIAWTGGQYAIHDVATGAIRAKGDHLLQTTISLSIEFSADSSRFALCSPHPAEAIVVDSQSGRQIAELKSADPRVKSIRFTPSGEIIGVLQSNTQPVGSFVLIDAATGRQLRTIGKPSATTAFAVSPDGKAIVTGGNAKSESEIIEFSTGNTIGQIPTMPSLRRLVYSPNGQLLAGSRLSSGVIELWDMPGRRLHALSPDPLNFFRSRFSPDGRSVLLDWPDRRLMDWRTGHIVRRFPSVGDPKLPRFDPPVLSPDMTVFAVPDYLGSVRIAHGETGRLIHKFDGHRGSPRVSFSGDSRRLASYDSESIIRVWDVNHGTEVARFALPDRSSIQFVGLSDDGRTLGAKYRSSGAASGTLAGWTVNGKSETPFFQGSTTGSGGVAMSPNGRYMTSVERQNRAQLNREWAIQLWDIKIGRQMHSLKGHASQAASTLHSAFSSDSRWLATGDSAGRLKLWEVITGQEVYHFEGHRSSVMPSFSPDGRLLLAASQEAPCFIWEIVPAAKPEEVDAEAAWVALVGADARAAFLAFRQLAANPQAAIPVLRRNLSRMRGNDAARIEQWIRDLDSKNFADRESAAAELHKIAERIEPRLTRVREKAPLEVRTRIDAILEQLTRPSIERLTIQRSLGVLETIAQPECVRMLKELSAGHSDDALTLEATESLERLSRRGVK
jgi:WD40 repeat protein